MTGLYAGWVRSAYLLCGDRQSAEDLVQTVLVKVYARWKHVRRHENVPAYVQAALTRTYISGRRRRWHGEHPTADIAASETGSDPIGAVDDRQALTALLATLPARQRAAVVLRFYHRYSEMETAQMMDCSVGGVKALTRRGLQALRSGRPGVSNQPLTSIETSNSGARR